MRAAFAAVTASHSTSSVASFLHQLIHRTASLLTEAAPVIMIPEPNLWADLRERDRGLDETLEYPPHHREMTLSRQNVNMNNGGNCLNNGRGEFLKEELEMETGSGNPSASAVTVSSAASMNNVNAALDADALRQRQRWTRRWYLLVIVLLYIGLLASFSLNVSLLLRKQPASTSARTTASMSAEAAAAAAASMGEDGTLLPSQPLDGSGKPEKLLCHISFCLIVVSGL